MEKKEEIECSKCHKKILSSNKMVHELQCKGVPQQANLPVQDNSEFLNVNRIDQNMNGNRAPLVSPNSSNVNANNDNNNEADDISDLFYCNVCDNYMPKEEKEDHMYSHQMENQNIGSRSNINITSNLDSNLSRTSSLGSSVSDDMNMRSSNLSGSRSSFDNPPEFTSFYNNYRNTQNLIPNPNQNLTPNLNQHQNPNNEPNTIVTTLPNGRVQTVTYDPNTGMVTEVITGDGFESTTTYPRNNPNTRSMTTRSNNSNNFVQFSGSQPNQGVMFPPGFPFNNIGGTSANFGMGMGFPFGGSQINFDNQASRGRRSRRDRNDLGQIFGLDNGDFDSWMQNILRGIDLGSLHSHHADYTQLIDELPEMTVDEKSKIPQDKNECMICMSNFQMNEKVKIMPCTHFFHTACIREWFKDNDTCPICKYSVSEEGNQGFEGL